MRQRKRIVDRVSMERASVTAKGYIENIFNQAERLKADPEKKERIEKCLCKFCYYSASGWGGAAMTNRPCGICESDELYSSTNTDTLCKECSSAHDLCKHCGADINLRVRRKTYSWE